MYYLLTFLNSSMILQTGFKIKKPALLLHRHLVSKKKEANLEF